MEIIFRGVVPSEVEYEGTCKNCKTVVKFQRFEGVVTSDPRDGNFIAVKCPVCNEKIYNYL